jgi:hypothetical protein
VFNFLADLVENNSESISIASQDEIFEEIVEKMVIQKILSQENREICFERTLAELTER